MRNKFLVSILTITSFVFLQNCANNSEEDVEPVDLVVNDFLAFIDQNPETGASLGVIDATTITGTLAFEISSQSATGALNLDAVSGELTINDPSVFVFADNPQVTAQVEVTNGTETKTASVTININDPDGPVFNIWTGSKFTFSKSNGSDPNNEANQDRITDNVWITRGNEGGQIFNIRVESSSNKTNSPTGTEWARGTTANIANLTFRRFRDTISPKSSVGQDLVLHLIEDDIYLDIKFTSWSSGKRGGFAYERSTPQ